MSTGDQFHDTLHQTTVRREIAANERRSFVTHAREELGVLDERYSVAARKLEQKAKSAQIFDNVRNKLLILRQTAEEALARIEESDEDGWYPARDQFEAGLEELREEMRALELLAG